MNFKPGDRVRHINLFSTKHEGTVVGSIVACEDVVWQGDIQPRGVLYVTPLRELRTAPRTHEEIAAEYAEVLGSTDLDPCQNPCPSYDESGCNVCHASRYHAIILAAIEEAVVH